MKGIFIILLMLTVAPLPASSASIDEAWQLFQQGKYDEANNYLITHN